MIPVTRFAAHASRFWTLAFTLETLHHKLQMDPRGTLIQQGFSRDFHNHDCASSLRPRSVSPENLHEKSAPLSDP
jgi:hypothetical protein